MSLTVVSFILMVLPVLAHGQVTPVAVKPPANISAFGSFTYGHSDFGKEAIYGVTIGGFIQSHHLFGLEMRGSALRYGGTDHQYSALIGPRVAFHRSRFTPYGAFLGGAGHARWQGETNGHLNPLSNATGIGGEWNLLGGVDFRASSRLSIRLGEISYSKIYVLPHGLTPTEYSAGLVYRLR